MATSNGVPGATLPKSRPPISEPRELSERKLSTDSRSSLSIKAKGIETETGFWGGAHRKEGAASSSKRCARAVESVIRASTISRQFYSQSREFHKNFCVYYPKL